MVFTFYLLTQLTFYQLTLFHVPHQLKQVFYVKKHFYQNNNSSV